MKVLSLFDGMACGALALRAAGIEIDSYDAFEIDKYAIKTSTHNFPFIRQHGDVFEADFTKFEGVDLVCGGSPCTYWSIAQKNNRETEASGMGWELFQQYVRATREAKPRYFIYENNKSMSNAIRESITSTFGFEPIMINSALVSAQNRQRLYWVGKRNEDGAYSKVDVEQPMDRGILLKDILVSGVVDKEKAYCLKHQAGNARDYFKKHHTQIAFEPQEPIRIPEYGSDEKARPLNAYYPNNCGGFEHRMFSENPNKQQVDMVAEPVKHLSERELDYMVRDSLGNYSDRWSYLQKPGEEDKSLCITANISKGVPYNVCAEPVRVGAMPNEAGELGTSQSARVYGIDGKSTTLNAGGGGAGAKTGLYACPVSGTIDKPIYEVRDGLITIKGKQYPIKLADGYYIIRKLTVRECMRLQTVPEWFEFPVSDTQAYKMLGNGWTVEVIAHILSYMKGA